MRIFVKAKTRAKEDCVEKIDNTHFVVAVKEASEKGSANSAIAHVLIQYFKKPVRLVSGFSSCQKTFEIG